MSIFEPSRSPRTSRMLSVLRIVAGLIFVSAGTMKLFGFPPMPAGAPPVAPMSQLWIGAVLEVVGGTAIVLGLFTRPVAFVLAGEMAVAYFVFAGAGAWSLDALIARSRGGGASALS